MGEIAFTDFWDIRMVLSACRDLDLWPLTFWPNQYVPGSGTYVISCDKYSSNIYEDIVFTQFFGSLPAVTLTFYLLTPKSNQHIYEPKYICDQNWLKFPLLVFEIWCSQRFRDAQTHTRTHSQTDRTDSRMPPAPFLNISGSLKNNCYITIGMHSHSFDCCIVNLYACSITMRSEALFFISQIRPASRVRCINNWHQQ